MRFVALIVATHAVTAFAADALYTESFEKSEAGKLPPGFTAYAGAFKVAEEGGRKFLELPGAPLDTFGVLFGPALQPTSGPLTGAAKFHATSVKRKAPAFGISLGGVGGYRLQVSAAKSQLEVFKGDEARATAPYQWSSEVWTSLRIGVKQDGGKWVVQGKAWPADAAEPGDWMITYEGAEPLPAGKAAVWGNPFSGTPIRFDDLSVGAAATSGK